MKITIDIPDEHAYYMLGDLQVGLLRAACNYRSGRVPVADSVAVGSYADALERLADQIASYRPRSP